MSKIEHMTAEETALFDAFLLSENEALETITELIANGSNVDSINAKEESLLQISIAKGYNDVAIYLINENANVNYHIPVGGSRGDNLAIYPPICIACLVGANDVLNELIQKDISNKFIQSSLIYASFIHSHAFQPWEKDFTNQSEQIECMKTLISIGANVNAQDGDQNTPLHILCKYNPHWITPASPELILEAANILINAGANVNAVNRYNSSPLHYVCRVKSDQTTIIQFLINQGANMNSKNNQGATPLHSAVRNNSSYSVINLLEADAEVDSLDNYGNSPLHMIKSLVQANSRVNLDIIKDLVNYGADVNLKNDNGETLLNSLQIWNDSHLEVALFLVSQGANPNITDNNGNKFHKSVNESRQKAILDAYTDCTSEVVEKQQEMQALMEQQEETMEQEHQDFVSNLTTNYNSVIQKKDYQMNEIKKQRDNTYSSFKDMKNLELNNIDKKTHDIYQNLKQYEKKYKTFKKANQWLFLIFLVVIIGLIFVIYKKTNIIQNTLNKLDYKRYAKTNTFTSRKF